MNFITNETLFTSRDIKKEARAQLEGYWRSAIILSLIPSLFGSFTVGRLIFDPFNESILLDISEFLINILLAFLSLGVAYTFLDFLRKRISHIEPLDGVIQAFKKKYFSTLFLLQVSIYIRTFLWTLLLIIPGIIKSYAYSQAHLIYKDIVDRTGEQPSPKDCIEESEHLMKGHKMELFRLNFSFIGWIILTVFTFGIGLIWLIPYMSISNVIFYENLAQTRYYEPIND